MELLTTFEIHALALWDRLPAFVRDAAPLPIVDWIAVRQSRFDFETMFTQFIASVSTIGAAFQKMADSCTAAEDAIMRLGHAMPPVDASHG